MKKYYKFLLLLPLLILLILGFARSQNSDEVSLNTNVVKEFKANLIQDGKSYDISQYIGASVLDAMDQTGIDIEKSGEGENSFVTAIGGKSADPKKREFWELLVNKKQAEVGAGSYKIQNGDQIEWKLSNY